MTQTLTVFKSFRANSRLSSCSDDISWGFCPSIYLTILVSFKLSIPLLHFQPVSYSRYHLGSVYPFIWLSLFLLNSRSHCFISCISSCSSYQLRFLSILCFYRLFILLSVVLSSVYPAVSLPAWPHARDISWDFCVSFSMIVYLCVFQTVYPSFDSWLLSCSC